MEPSRLVLDNLAAAEVEPYVLAVEKDAGRLQAPHRLAHAVAPAVEAAHDAPECRSPAMKTQLTAISDSELFVCIIWPTTLSER